MKKFTKLLMTLAMLFAVGVVNAQEKVYATFDNCTSGGNLTWDGTNMEFSWNQSYSNQLHGIETPKGNITSYEKVVVDCTIEEGDGYRIMFYASNKGTTAGGITIITESGPQEFSLSDFAMDADYLTQCSEFCLSGYNGSGKVKVNEVYFVKANDPLAGAKSLLLDAITIGKNVNPFAKTASSYQAVTDAVNAGESEYASASATAESLEAAKNAINDAIAALELESEYSFLTADMFLKYASVETPGEGEKAYPAFELNKASDLPYGDGNVGELNWADLSSYDKLIVIISGETKPRFCLNRLVAGGQQAATQEESQMLDINPNNDYAWSTDKYQTIDGNMYIIDLKAIVADYGYARLHCIKKQGWGTGVNITDLLLFKAADPLASYKEALLNAIQTGELQSPFAKTSSSWDALQQAIITGQAEYSNPSATESSLTQATTNIEGAIEALELEEGYSVLTADMFKKYESVDNPGEGETAYPSYEIGKASDLPYGDGNVGELNWADLSNYDKLIVVTASDIKPRFCLNRLVAGGQQAATKEESQMLDINPNNDFTWSTESYQTVEDNIYTIDLDAIVDDYGFARLHCIKKQGWGEGVVITGLYLYSDGIDNSKGVKVGPSGYATYVCEEDVVFTGVEAYAAKYEDGKVRLIAVTEAPAGTPVIVKAAEGSYTFESTPWANTIEANDLLVSDGTIEGDGTIFVLADGAQGVGFYRLDNNVKVPNGKGYLEIAAAGRDFIGLGDATAIVAAKGAQKSGAVYNLGGQRVEKAVKGVYIIGGKKVVK